MRQGHLHKFRERGGKKKSVSMTDVELDYIEDTLGDEIEDIPSYEVEEALEEYRDEN